MKLQQRALPTSLLRISEIIFRHRMKLLTPFASLGLSCLISSAALPPLQVSENHRFLVAADGQPFFYLGDTAWALFSCLDRENAATYLEKRSLQGFTVIQAALTFRQTNIYGKSPFVQDDPARPAMTPGHGFGV